VWLRPNRSALRRPHRPAAQPGSGPRAGRGDPGAIDRRQAAGEPHPRPAAQPARRIGLRGLPALPSAGARGLASWMGVASGSGGRGGARRLRADRSLARPQAGVVDRAAGGAAHRLAAAAPSLGRGQGLAAAGADAATQRRHARGARAGRLPGAARRHPARMAGQPRPSRDRVDQGLADQVVAAHLARGAPQGHLAEARPWQLGPAGARAARGGGSSRRRPGRRHQPARSRPAVRPGVAVAGSRLAGLRGPGDDPRRLADAVRGGPRVRGEVVDQAAARALEVLRPAA
jgi:hypothetical protein